MANKVWKQRYSLEEIMEIIDKIIVFQNDNKEWFDKGDFSYFVKMLLENGQVYVSKEAYKVIQCYDSSHIRFSDDVRKKLEEGREQDKYLQDVTHDTRKDWGAENELCWEHVVPTTVLVDLLRTKDLKEVIGLGIVCIVLKSENSRLTEEGYKDKMPDGWTTEDSIWARYQKVKIEVVGDPFKNEE